MSPAARASSASPAAAPDPVPLAGATLRAYRADWAHYTAWCAQRGFTPIPAAPQHVGAYLATLGASHAPRTIRRRLAAIGTMHRFNDLAWDARDRAIQDPLQAALRQAGPPPEDAAILTRPLLHRLLATCDASARGRRDRAVLLFGFTGALRRSEIVSLQVEDVLDGPGGLVLHIRGPEAGKGSPAPEITLPRDDAEALCPVLAFRAWQAVARRTAGPLFRSVSRAGQVSGRALHADAVRRILNHRVALAGLETETVGRLSAHALRAGFIRDAQGRGLSAAEILCQTRHRGLRSLRGYGLDAP